MTSRHLVDPALAPLLKLYPEFEYTVESLPAIREARALEKALAAAGLPPYPDIEVTERFVPARRGAPAVRVLLYRPRTAPRPLSALLWIHGGGYIVGNAEGVDGQVKGIVDAVGCAAVSVDYRLAPETPFPGPLEDCYAALKWLHTGAAELGVDAGRIAVGGGSAGAGLAAGLGLLARDRAEAPLVFQLLLYPMLDDRTVTAAAPSPNAGEFVWTPPQNRFGWASYLGQEPGGADVSPYAAAARAERLAGLPPAFIGVGALDLFLEEDVEYARRLAREGVATELHVYPGAPHGFYNAAGARVAEAATRDYLDALRRALGRGGGAAGVGGAGPSREHRALGRGGGAPRSSS